MDLLEEMRGLVDRLPETYGRQGIDAVTLHIERAEKHWQQAKKSNDEELFTDVIYRTNQAFEGALKEAYSILTEKDPSKKTPYEIEEYLEKSGALKNRVLALLSNYRKEWRNPSAHNYKLFFSEQEALLAIANVSTFSIILLEQINTKANENFEKERIKRFSDEVIGEIHGYSSLPFEEKVYSLLEKSYEYIEHSSRLLMKYEYVGLLTGFIEAVDPSIKVQSEFCVGKDMRADLMIYSDENKVLVEIKRYRPGFPRSNFLLKNAEEQLSQYLRLSGVNAGVLLLYANEATEGKRISKDVKQQSLFGFDDMASVTYILPTERDGAIEE